jgi:hypothetical protein
MLAYLPDAVVSIGMDGVIKFCNLKFLQALRYNQLDHLVGGNIKDLLSPESRDLVFGLIQGFEETHSQLKEQREEGRAISEGGYASSDANVASDQSSPLTWGSSLECNKKDATQLPGQNHLPSCSVSSSLSRKSSLLSTDTGTTKDDSELRSKKQKTNESQERACDTISKDDKANDDVDGKNDTAYAAWVQMDRNSRDVGSNESSEDIGPCEYKPIDATGSGQPRYNIRLIGIDQSVILCEMTFSIFPPPNNEGRAELGIIDFNPKFESESAEEPQARPEQKELLLCFRRICIEDKGSSDSTLRCLREPLVNGSSKV